jgi:elongation of very long chain fatty acids protein 7
MLGVINLFVHGFMYLYYFLAAMKPNLSKSVWKKRITQIQLVQKYFQQKNPKIFFNPQIQFFVLVIHYLRGALAPNCEYPKFWMWLRIIQNVFMLSLFGDFYYKAYIKKRNKKSE